MASRPVLKLNFTVNTELLDQLVMMGFPKELSEKALTHTTNNPNLSLAIDWMQAHENDMKIDDPPTTEPLPQVKEPPPQQKIETKIESTPKTVTSTTEQIPLSEQVSKTASMVNFPAAAMLVESRITKKMEEGKRQWELEQRKKEYERLQKEKRDKKEQETRVKAELESDRKQRAEKLGQGISQKDKEQQELEFRQKEAEKEKIRLQQRRTAERAEKERVLKLLEEDRLRRDQKNNPNFVPQPQNTIITSPPNPSVLPQPASSSAAETCMIQIRLPHGNPLRQKFSSMELLQDVHNFVASHLEPGLVFNFIIPMPRKEFTVEDLSKSLAELKLNGVSLTVLTSNKRGIVKQAEVPVYVPPAIHHHPPVYMDIPPPSPPPVNRETVADKIDKIPTYKFSPKPDQEEAPICLICQCQYQPDEDIKKLPCSHDFHTACVDSWLIDNDSCPLCTQKAYLT